LISCPLVEIARNGQPVKTLQSFTRQDGSSVHVEVYGAPMLAQINGQETTYVVESIRDLAKQLQYSHQQKHATLSQLAAGVAHEIRNPLASMRLIPFSNCATAMSATTSSFTSICTLPTAKSTAASTSPNDSYG
jgi:signal transduction histidine kinase